MNNLITVNRPINPIEAINAGPTTGKGYGFASSSEILNVFKAQGWQVDKTQVARTNNAENVGYQRHLVMLSNPALPKIAGLSNNNESSVRLCLLNAHNGGTALQVFLGVLRMACLNGILAGSAFRYFRAVHSKSIINKLGQGIDYVSNGIPDLVANIQQLQATVLTLDQRIELARLVLPVRFENVNGLINYDLQVVERALRAQDTAQDAYTVANRLQEYLIRGGIPYSYNRNIKDVSGAVIGTRVVHTTTRKIASIGTAIKLNETLFNSIKQVA